ncbi:MAG: MaoC family dehydratase [Candidatus Lokiarchaeota archaeon]|nr:MaoC family dehydratase [Candidatus Lokiarchaeota archaeon]
MSPQNVLDGIEHLKEYQGKEMGPSKWVKITQDKINMFAEATGDHQWIHVDVERAKKESTYGGPIAHGYLTLSLIPDLFWDVLEVKGFKTVINYGTNKVRFPAPVPVDSSVCMKVTLANITEIKNGVQCEFKCVLNTESGEKPVCIAEIVFLLMN